MNETFTKLCRNLPKNSEIFFEEMADLLLNNTHFMIAGKSHRFCEIEFYFNHKIFHPDVFAHGDPIQKLFGRWYFHRNGGAYKSGSFKGLDLTFGSAEAPGGVLIRSIEDESGQIIDGPCMCVDHILDRTGEKKVIYLDKKIGSMEIWDTDSPLCLKKSSTSHGRDIYRTARVGLTLKKARFDSSFPPEDKTNLQIKYPYRGFVMSPYRFLSEPKKIKKGKLLLILALNKAGLSPEQIREKVGSPIKSIERHIHNFKLGEDSENFRPYIGATLKSVTLAQLSGTWSSFFS